MGLFDRSARKLSARARVSAVLRLCAALAAAGAVLAGCAGTSARNQVTAVARAFARADDQPFLARNGRTLCALMTPSLRRELTGSAGVPARGGCADLIADADGTTRDAWIVDPMVSAVRIRGSRASATIRTNAGVGVLPLAREAGRWRVAGAVRYTSRIWLRADYRLKTFGSLSASSVASILVHRSEAIIGALAEAQAIGPDEVRLSVPAPARLADLRLVTQRSAGRLALYDWAKDALTPAGEPVTDQLRRRDASAILISQGEGTDPPGAAGGLSLHAALKLAAAQRPVSGAAPSRGDMPGVPPGRMVVAAPVPGDPTGILQFFVLRDQPALSRADIAGVSASIGPRGEPDILLEFTRHGAQAFQALTGRSPAAAPRSAVPRSPCISTSQWSWTASYCRSSTWTSTATRAAYPPPSPPPSPAVSLRSQPSSWRARSPLLPCPPTWSCSTLPRSRAAAAESLPRERPPAAGIAVADRYRLGL